MKTPEDIIILHLFTKNLDNIIYSSWNIECDTVIGNYGPFLSILLTFLKTQKIRILKKWKRLLEISSFYTCIPKKAINWGTFLEMWSEKGIWRCHNFTYVYQKSQSYVECDKCDRHNFLHFYPILTSKTKVSKKKWENLEICGKVTTIFD